MKRNGPTPFDLIASADDRHTICQFLGLAELSELRWRGAIIPEGDNGWRIEARLTARLAQDCVVTLDPVPTRIDEKVVRHFVPDADAQPIDFDAEEDDDPDTLDEWIDPGAVAIEILALALDPYPRAEGIEPVDLRATPPGAVALDDAALKPFAGLAALKAKLERD